MKRTVQNLFFLLLCFVSYQSTSQTLQGACIKANFGIDGYVYANGSEYVGAGSIINTNSADDWFYNSSIYPGSGRNVIDTTGSVYYKSILLSGTNTFFASPMSLPANSVVAGKRWQDATYARDYFGGTGATDSTSYTSASKNGEPLDEWATGPANVTPKNDLIDCYSHMRRDGELATSPLWLFLGFSRISTNGESYFDGELFAKDVDYDPITGFASAGDEEGHTAWQFDTDGNITEIGDIVVTVNMSTNGAPTFEVRIWVRRFDFQNIDPATFDFGANFDGDSNSSIYGYADIVPPAGNEFGCGVTNEETWVGPPWGTLSSGGNYSLAYEPGQFVEIGLNLFEFGIDPQLVEGMDGCDLPFSNILFKSRASNSFTAQLKDFSGPFGFLNLNEVEIQLAADSITCYDPVIPISVDNNFPNFYYEWSTPNGNIVSNINDTLIYVDAPGMYILASAFIDGCELNYDTIYVNAYTDLPPANILSDTIYDCNNVIANLSAADSGYIYAWLGPSNVSYFGQSISVTGPGIYYLYVQNQYGCVGTDSIYVIEYPCQDVSTSNISTTVILDTLPPFFTPPPAITIDCGYDYLDLGITGDVFDESDNCDPLIEAIFTDSFNTSGYCEGTGQIIRNWTLTDDCGNEFTATQEIILIDTVAPVFTAPNDVTINCDADYSDLSLTGGPPTVIDECDTVSVNITYVDSFETDYNCNGQTRIQRIWQAVDGCGNISQDTQMIMMVDIVGPQIYGVPNIPSVGCDSVPDPPTVIAVDNCDPNPTITFTEIAVSASCPNSYILIRTWTATDNCGNQTILTQEINVEDISNPIILSFPIDITISCDSIPPPFEPVVADDCDSEIDIDYSELQISGSCEGNYVTIRSWIWTDDCDNQSTAFQTITVQDNTPPTFTIPADVTFDCSVDLNNLAIVGDVTDEADNCTSVIGEATYTDNANYVCVGTGVIERTWNLTDDCGNVTEYVQTITISDTTPPVFSTPNDITIDCHLDENNLTVTGDVLDESDNCDNTLGQATYQDIIDVSPSCSLESSITRIWSLADDCGNITIDTQYILIVDTIAPTFDMPADITIDCQVDSEDFTIVGEATSVTDNCDQNLVPITYTDIFTADGNCIGAGTIERIWTISDECGNTTIDTQSIILIDTIPPVFSIPADISLDCEQDPGDLNLTGIVLNEFDNCYTALGEATYVDSVLNDIPCEGSMIVFRIWSLEDGCGNIATEIQTISVEDTTPPEFSTPSDITLNCFSELQDSLVVGTAIIINDNCSNSPGITYFQDSILVNDSCNYLIERAWFAEDACGNVAVDTQLIMIVDTIAPVFNENLDTLIIGCDSIPPPANLTASDNCDSSIDVVFSETIIPGSCNNSYTIIRTWTATDRCGNETIYTQNLEVLDYAEPIVFVFPADITVSCDSIPLVHTQNVEDNCTVNITLDFSENNTDGACPNDYTITRTWTWTDNCNNTSTYSQNITVFDDTPPVFTVPADITVDCTTDVNDLNFTGNISNASDNCDAQVGNAVYTDEVFSNSFCGESRLIQRTWSLSDSCGNTMFDLQVITVIDTLLPSFTTPNDVTINCGEDPNDLNLVGDVIDEFDSCTSSIGEASYTDSILVNTPCEGTSIIYRTWTLEDDCGNEFQDVQTITISDTDAPVFSNIPQDVTVTCDSIPLVVNPIVVDSCASFTVDFTEVNTASACLSNFILERKWIATDACGNQDSVIQVLTVIDTVAPVLSNVPMDITVNCEDLPSVPVLNFTDNCSDTVFVVFSENTNAGACIDIQIVTRNWTATDACGNQISISQQVTLNHCSPEAALTLPPDTTLCEFEPIDFEVNLIGSYPSPVYQWQYTTDTTLSWTNIAGATSSIYSIDSVTLADAGYYQVLVSNNMADINDTLCRVISDKTYLEVLPHAPLTNLADTICDGQTLFFNGQNLTSTGQYIANLTAANGCDSIVIMDLLVHPIYELTHPDTICFGENYTFGNSSFSTSGTYSFTFQTINNCDSLVHLELFVYDEIQTNLTDTICDGEALIFNSQTLTSTGQYTEVLTAANGCDSTVIIDLLVHPIYELTHPDTICFGEKYVFGNTIFSTSGSYSFTFSTINNCDSLVHLELFVYDEIQTNLTDTICDGETLIFNSQTLTTTGQYSEVLTAENGCDSTVIIDLLVNPTYELSHPDTICFGENYTFGNGTFSTSGTYSFTFQTINNCDSLVHLELFVYDEIQTNLTDTICDGEALIFNSQTLTTTGQYSEVLTAANGCDSTVIIDLLVHPIYELTHPDTICFGENYAFGNSSFSTSGTYSFTFQTINNCDSLVHLELFVYDEIQTNLIDTICNGETLIFNSQTLTTAGQYTEVLTAENGCDSTVIIDLVVNPTYELTHSDTICFGENYVFGNGTFSTSGTYSFTFQTINNCDSLVHLELLVYDEIQTNLTDTICDGETLIFNSQTLTTTGQYSEVLTAANGCDSTVIIDLLVHPIYELTHPDTICFGENYTFGNSTYTTTGNHSFTFSTINNCDSLVHLELFVYDEIQTNLTDTICDGETLIFNSQTLTATGQYSEVLTAANGCDSTVIIDLLVHPIYELTHSDTICFGENYAFGNGTFSTSGIYSFTFQTINNCDSLVHLELFVYDEIQTNLTDTICDGETLIFNSQTLTVTGQYTEVLMAANGCDSTVIIDLLVHPIYELTHPDTICFGENYVFGNSTYTTTGNHSFTFSTINNCDSLVHLELFVYDEIQTNLTDTICDGETLIFNSQTLTATGQYSEVLTALNGCDSTVIIDLLVNPTYELTHPETICFGEDYVFGNSTFSTSGTYSFTFSTINGCDSLVHLILEVDTAITTNLVEEICAGETYNFNGEIISTTGQYIDTLTAANSCDSFVMLDLTVYPVYEIFYPDTICEGENYSFGNDIYTATGTYSYTFQTMNGCDSLVNLELTVNDTFIVNLEANICEGETHKFGSNGLTQTGIYTDSLTTILGCDSLIVLNLTVIESTNEIINVDLCYGEFYQGTAYYQTSYLNQYLTNINGCDSIVNTNIYVSPEEETVFEIDLCEGESFENITYTQDAVLVDSLITINGCDSIIITNINVHPNYETTEIISLCIGTPYQGIVYQNDTIFTDNFQSEWGCDSVVIRQLQIREELFDSIDVIICLGETYQGTAYTDDTILTETGTSVNGCDSTFYTKIDVIFPSDTSIQVEICDGDNYVVNNTTYSQSGNYTQVVQSVNGCDSTINLELIVWDNYESTSVNYICEGDFYDGNQYFTSTVLTDSLTSIHGCDSILIDEINVLEPSSETQIVQVCEGTPYQGVVYSNDTILVDTLQNLGNCDSVVFYNITLVTEINISISQTLCYGENWNGTDYYQDSIFTNNYVSSGGCDSIVTTSITVLLLEQNTVQVELCEGETIFVGGANQSTSGTYSDTLTSVNGCDSFVTTIVTVNPVFEENSEFDICYGDSILIFGIYRSNPGNYVQNLSTQNGCDSTITISLNVGPLPASTHLFFYLCEGDSLLVGGDYQTTSGIYVDSLTSVNGCDSLITTTLELVNPIATYQVGSICEGDSLIIDKHAYFTAGNYVDTLTSYTGCDSIVNFQLTVHPVYEFTQDIEICQGETYFIGGAFQNATGTYYDNYTTINGCDSIWITNLLVKPLSAFAQEFNLCDGESIYVGGANQTTSGVYIDTYQNAVGCDSVLTTTVIFHPSYNFDFEVTICQNDSIFLGGAYQTMAGVYIDQFTTTHGCDSIITTVLNIFDDEIDYYIKETMCVGDSIFIAGNWQFDSGVFVENFLSINGCDSIVTTTLHVLEPNFIIGENAEMCFGDEVQLYLEGAEGVENITWYPDFSLSCNDCPNPVAYPDVTTTYTVTYPTGCNNEMLETQVTVVVIDLTPIELVETEVTILQGDTVILMIADADSSFTYTWIDNRGNVVCDTCFYLEVWPSSSTTYTVIANDPSTGCPDSETIIVNVRPPTCEDGTLDVANVIFPQSGGYGELLEIKHDKVEIRTLRIFNRWGELVFETDDVEDKWDGTFRGQLLNPAVYVYYIIGVCDDQTKFIYSGNVTLIH